MATPLWSAATTLPGGESAGVAVVEQPKPRGNVLRGDHIWMVRIPINDRMELLSGVAHGAQDRPGVKASSEIEQWSRKVTPDCQYSVFQRTGELVHVATLGRTAVHSACQIPIPVPGNGTAIGKVYDSRGRQLFDAVE